MHRASSRCLPPAQTGSEILSAHAQLSQALLVRRLEFQAHGERAACAWTVVQDSGFGIGEGGVCIKRSRRDITLWSKLLRDRLSTAQVV